MPSNRPRTGLTAKLKEWALIVALVFSSVSSIKFKVDKDGVEIELEKTKQALADAESNNFGLAGVNCE